MKLSSIYHKFSSARSAWLALAAAVAFLIVVTAATATVMAAGDSDDSGKKSYHVVTIYDNDAEKTVVTTAETVGDALRNADIATSQYDSVEPALDHKLEAAIMVVKVNRARPILVHDGQRQVRVITSVQDETDIAAAANVKLYPEDAVKMSLPDDLLLAGGAGLEMKITRAKVVNLRLYGQDLVVRTRVNTVAELLKEKKIELGPDDGMDLTNETKITEGMNLHIWRNGIQTVTATETVPFTTKTVTDPTRVVGYREIQVRGQAGQKVVIYEVEMRDGQEVNRKIISEVVSTPAVEQIEIVGTKSQGGLTKSKGVNTFMDSQGVVHRETYYDLYMGGVMRNCGQGGNYTVRADGVKVDRDGYVIIAAHLGRYPRCSVVETSVGLGKVYDTGGFVSRYPDGWDIATDWSNYDGR
jgi:uncharacterized protein YabE (DUF348 family)